MAKKYCCNIMKAQVEWKCTQHEDQFDCPDALIAYFSPFDEYGLIIHDGGSAKSIIHYCPWCGQKLPDSKRDLWFEKLEALGFKNPSFDDNFPEEFRSKKWYQIND